MVKNPSANVEDTGSIPVPGRVHMLPGNSARVPRALVLNKRRHGNEKAAHCTYRETPLTAIRESLRAAMETSAVIRKSNFKRRVGSTLTIAAVWPWALLRVP